MRSLAVQSAREDAALVPDEALRAVERLPGFVAGLHLEVERAHAEAARLLDQRAQRDAARAEAARRLFDEELVHEGAA